MRRGSGTLLGAALAAAVLTAGCGDGGDGGEASAAPPDAPTRPRSVILVVGDGMGPQQLALLWDWADAAGERPTSLARMIDAGVLGMLRTGAEGSPLTDSASAATALAAGVEVPNGFIAMTRGGETTPTCLEDARATRRATGLVTSTRLTHATPASFAAHVPNRGQEEEIGRQLVAESGVDVLLGGGGRFLDREAAAAAGYRIVTTGEELAAADAGGGRLLGVFADSHLPYAIDRDAEGEASAPTLADMTRKALEVLATDPDGFFLMVEGGRIDHGGHLNDVGAVLGEMRELDEVIGVAEAFRAQHPDTLVLVTADHETGGLGITSGAKPLLPETFLALARQERSIEAAAPPPEEREPVDPQVFGVGRASFYPRYSWWETSRALATSAESNCSYATQGHTTTPVIVAAAGPGQDRFRGLFDNEHVGLVLREWMQVAAPGDDR